MSISVDLPHPDGPSSEDELAVSTVRSAGPNACTAAAPLPKVFGHCADINGGGHWVRRSQTKRRCTLVIPNLIRHAKAWPGIHELERPERNSWTPRPSLGVTDYFELSTERHHREPNKKPGSVLLPGSFQRNVYCGRKSFV